MKQKSVSFPWKESIPFLIFTLTAFAVLTELFSRESLSGGSFVLWSWSVLLAGTTAVQTPMLRNNRFAMLWRKFLFPDQNEKTEESSFKAKSIWNNNPLFNIFPAWILLFFAIFATFPGSGLGFCWTVFFAISSLTAYTGGSKIGFKLLLPVLILTVLIPSQTFLYDLLSFPLSCLCSMITVFFLHLFGIQAGFDYAIIRLGAEQVAVTAACSGIELLETMLLIGWIIVQRNQNGFFLKLIHFGMLFPVIVLCNSLRLTGVILLYRQIGTPAFEDPFHTIFGFAVIIGIVLLMQFSSRLFRQEGNKDGSL